MKKYTLIALSLSAAVVIVILFTSFEYVPPEHQGVLVRKDGTMQVYMTGTHLLPPFTGAFHIYPAGSHEYRFPKKETYRVLNKNGIDMEMVVYLRLQFAAGAAGATYQALGADAESKIEAAVAEAVELRTAQFTFADENDMPPEFSQELIGDVMDIIGPAGISVDAYRVDVVDISDWQPAVVVDEVPLRKVVLIGVDSGDWDIINPLIEAGQLPNFQTLIEDGASGPLQSIEPLLSPLLWTTMATGKLPEAHGILNFTVTDPESGNRVPISRLYRQVDALWNMLSDYDRTVAVVGWLATFPAETINGVMVTDRVGYLAYADAEDSDASTPGHVYPPERAADIAARVAASDDVTYEEFAPFVQIERDSFLHARSSEFDVRDPVNNMIMLYASTQTYRNIALHLLERDTPDFLAVYFELVDATKHLFMHYAPPKLAYAEARRYERFKSAVAQAYILQDEIIGDIMNTVDDNTVIMVVSDHGFKSGPRRPKQRPEIWAGKAAFWHELDGIICIYGKGVKPGHELSGATILDVAPTVLALQGLPKPDDMPGVILADAFYPAIVDGFNSARVSTLNRKRANEAGEVAVDGMSAENLKKLEALGYITPDNPDAHNNLGQRLQKQGKFNEAIAEFKKALEINPNFPAALNNLGVCYGQLKQYELADQTFRRALELNPQDAYAMNNLAIMYMQLGRFERAATFARQAVTVEPNYANAHLTLGSIYANAGQFAAAALEFEKVLEIEPGHRGATINLERIRKELEQ